MTQGLMEILRLAIWLPVEESYAILAAYLGLCAVVRETDPFEAIPYLMFTGAPGSGKTESCVLLASLANGEMASNVSRAALFHWTSGHSRFLLAIDEASHLGHEYDDLLNGGYLRGGKVLRYVAETQQTEAFSTYGPKIIAAVHLHLSPALLQRTIPVEFREAPMTFCMTREPSQEHRTREVLFEWARREGEAVRERHEHWRSDTSGVFVAQRERQVWAPMFAVGEVLGLLDPLKMYLGLVRQVRDLRRHIIHWERLDTAVRRLSSDLEAKGWVPFGVLQEHLRPYFDGDQPSDRAVGAALLRGGFQRREAHGETLYAAPRPLLGRLFGR